MADTYYLVVILQLNKFQINITHIASIFVFFLHNYPWSICHKIFKFYIHISLCLAHMHINYCDNLNCIFNLEAIFVFFTDKRARSARVLWTFFHFSLGEIKGVGRAWGDMLEDVYLWMFWEGEFNLSCAIL